MLPWVSDLWHRKLQRLGDALVWSVALVALFVYYANMACRDTLSAEIIHQLEATESLVECCCAARWARCTAATPEPGSLADSPGRLPLAVLMGDRGIWEGTA